MSDLREQAERMVAEVVCPDIRPDMVLQTIKTNAAFDPWIRELFALAVRLQVELLAEKPKESRG